MTQKINNRSKIFLPSTPAEAVLFMDTMKEFEESKLVRVGSDLEPQKAKVIGMVHEEGWDTIYVYAISRDDWDMSGIPRISLDSLHLIKTLQLMNLEIDDLFTQLN